MFEQPLTRKQKKFLNCLMKVISKELDRSKSWLSWNEAYEVLAGFNVRLVFTAKAKGKKK